MKIGLIAAAGLSALAGLAGVNVARTQGTPPGQRRSRVRTAPWQPAYRNGDREKSRRLRQIERGQLTAANGLEIAQ